MTVILRVGDEMHSQFYEDAMFIKLKESNAYVLINRFMQEMLQYFKINEKDGVLAVPSFSTR